MNLPESLWTNILDMDFAWNEDGKVWFIGHRLKYIFCADIDKKEIRIICKLPGLSVSESNKYQQIIKYGNKLFCLPNLAKDILIYDIESCKINKLLIKDSDKYIEMACTCAGIMQDNLYIVAGWNVRKIIVLNIKEEKIVHVFNVECNDAEVIIGAKSIIYKGKIYMPVRNKEEIISFDIETYEFAEHFIPGDICGCALLYHDAGNGWIIGRNYGIIKWNLDTNEFFEVENIPAEFKLFSVDEMGEMVDWYAYTEKRAYAPSSMNLFCEEGFCNKNSLCILPYFSNSIMRINTDTMQIQLFQIQTEQLKENYYNHKGMPAFSLWGCGLDGNLRIVSRRDCKIYCIDMKTMSGKIENWVLSEEAIQYLLNDLFDKKVLERKRVCLETLIYGVEKEYIKEKNARAKNNIGAQIYCSI